MIVGVSYELIRFAAKRAARPDGHADAARALAAAHHHPSRHPMTRPTVAIHALEGAMAARKSAGRRTGNRLNGHMRTRDLDAISGTTRRSRSALQRADRARWPIPRSSTTRSITARSPKPQSELSEVVGKYREWKKAASRADRRPRRCSSETDPDLQEMAELEVAAAGAGAGTARRTICRFCCCPRIRTTRRTSCSKSATGAGGDEAIAVRRRSFSHVHPLRRRTALESGSHVAQRIVGRRHQGSDRAHQRQRKCTAG